MNTIHAEYQITLSDFRKATYYALFLRHQKALRVMFVVLIGVILYALGAYFGLGKANAFVFFIGAAYLIWGIILFAGTEKTIRKYIKSPNCFIGKTYLLTIEAHKITFEMPENGMKFTTQTAKLACAFELAQIFLIYISGQEVYIIPQRVLSDEERVELRSLLNSKLKDRFSTRFK